jgi:NTP pyrophosphatase (non-canonical NTP hydrolase)
LDSKQYLKESGRTVSNDYPAIEMRMKGEKMVDLLHAAIGMQTEAAEFSDAIKKTVFYGKVLDEVNLREELGDILFYIALALRALDTDFDSVMDKNINKLKIRYPDKFDEYLAQNRDLDEEYTTLQD